MQMKNKSNPLTVHRNVKGKTKFPLALSGSVRVKELPPSTGLEVLPKEHGPLEVTLLWYSLRHTRNSVLHCTGQEMDGSGL
ncbi:hypothetical protein M8J76_007219 [Diaphorina citri]|nr:hypothetical protein M8J76_007219 [Diaphorina citri]